MRARQNLISSRARASLGSTPAGCTTARTTSPRSGSGTPTAATSSTAGCRIGTPIVIYIYIIRSEVVEEIDHRLGLLAEHDPADHRHVGAPVLLGLVGVARLDQAR